MDNFTFSNPTKLIFGKGTIARLADNIPADARLMLTFGGGSVKANGVYDQVVEALREREFIEFWGIEPNPKIETLREAIALGKEHNIDYLLSVGGGSVLDGTKLISVALGYGGDAWDLVTNPKLVGKFGYVPFGDVMTLPATGSEMNVNAVISSVETGEKFGMRVTYPRFSILDPMTTFSLPDYQVANGIADTWVHTTEAYLNVAGESMIMDRWAEGILLTLKELAPRIIGRERDYDAMANFMLSATMALNGFISMGVTQDWATHGIGHEITALTGLTHGHTLAIVLPSLLSVMRTQKLPKLVQYAERVWGITEGTDTERADRAITETESFFRSLGLETRLSERMIADDVIEEIVRRFRERGTMLGEMGNIDAQVVEEILNKVK